MDTPVPRPLKILVVDDDRTLNKIVALRLRRAGFLTDSAFDGESALAALQKNKFDLLVLDLVMPGMPGFEVLREIRKLDIHIHTVVLSLLRQEEDVRLVKELGASEYFIKSSPTFMDNLVAYAEQLSIT